MARHPSIDGTLLEDSSVPEALVHTQQIHDNLEEAKASLTLSKEHDKHFADQQCQADPFIIGPFTILEAVGRNAYKLDLPPSMTMHPVFNVSHLAKCEEDKIEGHVIEPPPPIETPEGKEEYEVECILLLKVEKGTHKHYVKWEGYMAEHDSWEPLENLGNTSELIQEFHKEYAEAILEVPKVARKLHHEETKDNLVAKSKEEQPIQCTKGIKEAAAIQVPHQKVFTLLPPALKPLATLAHSTALCLALPTPPSVSTTMPSPSWPCSRGPSPVSTLRKGCTGMTDYAGPFTLSFPCTTSIPTPAIPLAKEQVVTEYINLTEETEDCQEAIVDLMDEEEDYGVWKGTGLEEDPFVLNDEEEFVLVEA